MQQLASGLYIPDAADPPDLKALFDGNWNLLDTVIPDGASLPVAGRPYRIGRPGASKRAAPIDHSHPGLHSIMSGYGIANVRETAVSIPLVGANTDNLLYTCPADAQFAWAPIVYLQNGNAATITVTVKVSGVTVRVVTVNSAAASAISCPPLLPGETITVAASAGPAYSYAAIFEMLDPSMKFVRNLNVIANTVTVIYTVPNNINGARTVYMPNLCTTAWWVSQSAGTAYLQYLPANGSGAVNANAQPYTANTLLQLQPVQMNLLPGDVMRSYSTTGGAFWTMLQEF